jgi:hypothetical protein
MQVFLAVLISFLFVIFLYIIKYLFGTFSPYKAYYIFKVQKELEQKYVDMFKQRDSLLYHIAWSKVLQYNYKNIIYVLYNLIYVFCILL